MSELTVQAAWVAALAILALTLVGFRKPARAAPPTPRGPQHCAPGPADAPCEPTAPAQVDLASVPVAMHAAPLEGPVHPLRRALAGISALALSVITGAVLAILLSFAAVIAVVWATDLLGR